MPAQSPSITSPPTLPDPQDDDSISPTNKSKPLPPINTNVTSSTSYSPHSYRPNSPSISTTARDRGEATSPLLSSPVRARRPYHYARSSISEAISSYTSSRLRRISDISSHSTKLLQKKTPHAVTFLFTPRVFTSILLWAAAVWLIHRFLLPLPIGPVESTQATEPSIQQDPIYVDSEGNWDWNQTVTVPSVEIPVREGRDELDSIDPRWRPLSPLKTPDAPYPKLRDVRYLPRRCMEEFFLLGETNCTGMELGPEERIDVTWVWVNGTDPRWIEGEKYWTGVHNISSPAKHYRENNELVHSMRSVLSALPGKVQNFHLISTDYPFRVPEDLNLISDATIEELETQLSSAKPQRYSGSRHGEIPSYNAVTESGKPISDKVAHHLNTTWRVAQTPTWLDYSKRDTSLPEHPFAKRGMRIDNRGPLNERESNYPSLRYAVHSEIFHIPTKDYGGIGEAEWRDERFQESALPCYNSMAIESRLTWVPGLADVTLTMNDDFFMLKELAVSDFHSPFYGTVIRLDPNYGMQVKHELDPNAFSEAGENGGLFHANWLLSQRFPKRLRPYASHVPKTISREIHAELSLMFSDALTASGVRKFREMEIAKGDVQTLWLSMMLMIERWREGLLWTFTVAGLGQIGQPGVWGNDARDHLKNLFGLEEDEEDVVQIEVHKGDRETFRDWRSEHHFGKAGWEAPKATAMLFSSMDGHLPALRGPGNWYDPNKCTIDLEECFGEFWTDEWTLPAEDMFTRMAFEKPQCGDCMITALVTASGPLGLSAFFPASMTTYKMPSPTSTPHAKASSLLPPHLPLTPTWQEADFSIENVMKGTAMPGEEVELRDWCMKLLTRYKYVTGRSVSSFHQLYNAHGTGITLNQIDRARGTSFLGINDDIYEDYDKVRGMLQDWFERKWPKKAVWERQWDSQTDHVE